MLRKVTHSRPPTLGDWGAVAGVLVGETSSPYFLLRFPQETSPTPHFPFQYMEFRKTMDIDHILDWQPPEVS